MLRTYLIYIWYGILMVVVNLNAISTTNVVNLLFCLIHRVKVPNRVTLNKVHGRDQK